METSKDITSRDDIEFLVDRFYERVRDDTRLAPKFQHVDWPSHLPVMYNFWASMILGEQSYRGQPFQKHLSLGLVTEDFTAWVTLFRTVVDECFQGEQATEMKTRAEQIAMFFQHKLGLDP